MGANDDHWYLAPVDPIVLGQQVETLETPEPLILAKISSEGLESKDEPAVITVTGESLGYND